MERTTTTATIIGSDGAREYEFLVDTGSTHIGLPLSAFLNRKLTNSNFRQFRTAFCKF